MALIQRCLFKRCMCRWRTSCTDDVHGRGGGVQNGGILNVSVMVKYGSIPDAVLQAPLSWLCSNSDEEDSGPWIKSTPSDPSKVNLFHLLCYCTDESYCLPACQRASALAVEPGSIEVRTSGRNRGCEVQQASIASSKWIDNKNNQPSIWQGLLTWLASTIVPQHCFKCSPKGGPLIQLHPLNTYLGHDWSIWGEWSLAEDVCSAGEFSVHSVH